MAALETLQHSQFADLIGDSFTLEAGGKKVSVKLNEVRPLGHRRSEATRDPFALTFLGLTGWRVPQGIYPLSHPSIGVLEIFITQVGDGPEGSTFEAVFT